MKYIIYIMPIFCLFGKPVKAQTFTGSDIVDKYTNQVIDSCLLKLYPDADENILGRGRNYRYFSFKGRIENKPDTIEIMNFGDNSTHRPALMLIAVRSNNVLHDEFLLCQQSLAYDLDVFRRFFGLYASIRESYQLEMIEIWVQSRKGILRTGCYIH